jgi:phosphoenolpyruvate-protein kinase (PTS system EI component)
MIKMKSIIYKGEVLSEGFAEGIVVALEEETEGKIIVAKKITPLDALKVVGAAGIIIEEGGKLSHIAIYTRELGIP